MPVFNRPFPPPPPQQQPQTLSQDVPQNDQTMRGDKHKLSQKTKFGLLIAGGVASFAVATACLVLLFIL